MVESDRTDRSPEYADAVKTRDHVWQYFAFHADQRIRTFNFFLVISTVFIAGSLAAIREDLLPQFAGTLGLYSLTLLSFIFWKLDQRNRTLIKSSEAALKKIEAYLLRTDGSIESAANIAIFTQEEQAHEGRRSTYPLWKFWAFPLTYSESFRAVFFIVGALAAILGSLLALDVGG